MINAYKEPVPAQSELSNQNTAAAEQTEIEKTISDFLEKTNADEISKTLALMLDAQIVHGEADRMTNANSASLAMSLSQLFFKLENYLKTVSNPPCLHS